MGPRSALLLAAPVVLLLAGPLSAAEFSADFVDTARVLEGQAPESIGGKLFVKGSRIRRDAQPSWQDASVIIDLASGTTLTLMRVQKLYTETGAVEGIARELARKPTDPFPEGKVEKLGSEKVAGYDCDKVRFTWSDPARGTATQWFSPRLQWPLKVVVSGKGGTFTSELSNIREGGVADSLFLPPPGFSRMEVPKVPAPPGEIPGGVKVPGF